MSAQIPNDYYLSQKSQLLKQFDSTIRRATPALLSCYGTDFTDTVIAEARQEYEALIPRLPYIGGKENPLTWNLIGAAWFLALYRVLIRHGKSFDEIGGIIYEAHDAWLGSVPSFLLRLWGRWKFTRFAINKLQQQAQNSQARPYPGDWVYTAFRGKGSDFNWGIDFTECGICKFLGAEGAAELTPYLCMLDFPMSERAGLGLVRTGTLGEGAAKCDFRYKANRATAWPSKLIARIGFSTQTDKLKVLVYGAGVLGSLYAARLQEAGHQVSILARGQRLADLQKYGIVLENTLTGQQTVTPVSVVESLEPDDPYDLVIVLMRKNQVPAILPALAANHRTPNIVFMTNNAAGSDTYVNAVGCERILMGFPGVGGGTRQGHVIRYRTVNNIQVTTLGELDGRITPRLKQVGNLFTSAGFAVALSTNMDAWLKTHVAIVSPVANALYMANGDNYRLACTRDGLVLLIRAIREGFQVLQACGIPITPAKYRILKWLPEPLLVTLLQRLFDTQLAEIALAGHAGAAPDEMKHLAEEFKALASKTTVATPAIDRLYTYLDPAVSAVSEGSAQLPLNWCGSIIVAGLCFVFGLLARRRHSIHTSRK